MNRAHLGLLIAALLVSFSVGCASPSGPRPISWELISHGPMAGVSTVENEQLILENRQIRTTIAYSTPLTVECEVAPDSSTNSVFSILFVPVDPREAAGNEFERSFEFRYVDPTGTSDTSRVAWWVSPPKGTTCLLWDKSYNGKEFMFGPGQMCRLRLSLAKDHAGVMINGHDFGSAPGGIPYREFRIALSTLGATNRWHVRNFSIH